MRTTGETPAGPPPRPNGGGGATPAAPAGVNGVNVCGYLRTESGVGAAARGYVRGLRAGGVPVALRDLSSLSGNRARDTSLADFATDLPYDVNLVCADVEPHFAVAAELGEGFLHGDRYNVGVWAWELTRFPEKWRDRFGYYDEIWVASSFIANALALVSPVPVVRVPPVLTVPGGGSRDAGRQRLGVSPGDFVFLFVFDFNSHIQRKNPLATIEAFKRAFGPSDAAHLVIKCVNPDSNRTGYDRVLAAARGARVSVHAGYWPAAEVRDLTAACDAYVSLHRSEGTGLTVTDAMALGKPVIATGWSGNMDFMNVANSFPVRYRLVEIEEQVGPYPAGEVWAEPDVDHAAELMRLVFDDRATAEARGRAARDEMEANYSEAAVAGLIGRRLEAVATRRWLPQYREEMKGRFYEYQRLRRQVVDAVRQATPDGASVAVVSKGDDQLVALDGRSGMHFPQTPSGTYAGHYPADGAEAVAQLEAVRAKGARYLLFPKTAFWWLDHYGEFRRHLDERYRRVVGEEHCIMYELSGGPADAAWRDGWAEFDARIDAMAGRAEALGRLAAEADERLARRDGAWRREAQSLRAELSALRERLSAPASPPPPPPAAQYSEKQLGYRQLVQRIRDTAGRVVPERATVAVVSKGDEELLRLSPGGQTGWHFPRAANGVYGGHHPADSAAAIAHLEALKAQGAGYLLFPSTAFWWLEYYREFREHIDRHYHRAHADAQCVIYELAKPVAPRRAKAAPSAAGAAPARAAGPGRAARRSPDAAGAKGPANSAKKSGRERATPARKVSGPRR